MKDRFKNSSSPVKAFGRLLMLLFCTGLVFIVGYLIGIDPASYSYGKSVIYFGIIYLLSYPIQVGFEYAKYKHLPNSMSFMYGVSIEFIIFILFTLLMPFTGDLSA